MHLLKKILSLNEEKGAIALATLAFLAGFFSVALVLLWTLTQILGASSYLQSTAETAAYAAVNRVDPISTGAITIDCAGSNVESNFYLCNQGRALQATRDVFRVALGGKPFGLCYNLDDALTRPCDGDPVDVVARSTAPDGVNAVTSIKAFEMNEARARQCNPRGVDAGIIDKDFGDSVVSDTAAGKCWILVNSRYLDGNLRYVRVEGLNNVTPGVIVRTQATIKPPIIGFLGASFTLEASAVALRGQAVPPNSLDGY